MRSDLASVMRRGLGDPERRLMLAGLVDAGLSSLATFAIGAYASHSLSPALLGGYALVFSAFSLAAIIPDAAVFTPLEVLVVRHPRSERLALLRYTLRTGFLAALLPAMGVSLWKYVAPSELPIEAVQAFTVTAFACAILSPVQDHVRRMLHSGGASWLAATVASVQLLTALAGISLFAVSEMPLWWAPFGVLGAANLLSMLTGLLLLRLRSNVEPVTPTWHLVDLTRSSGWMLLVGLLPAGATFLGSALVADLASPAALGYAETARIVAQPLMVLTMGLSATFSPKLVAAAQMRDGDEARRLRHRYLGLVIVASVAYAAIVSQPWAGNPMRWLVPKAYVVQGLATITLLSVFAQSLALPGRFEMLGARRERELMLIEAVGNVLRVVSGGASRVLGAFAIPFGVLALCVGRVLGQSRVLRLHYEDERETSRVRAASAASKERATPAAVGRSASEPAVPESFQRSELDVARADAQALLASTHGHSSLAHGDDASAADGSTEGRPPLRVGVLLEEGPQPRWVADLLAALRAFPFCGLALVVWMQPDARSEHGTRGWAEWLRTVGRHWLYAVYTLLDEWVFGVTPAPFGSERVREVVRDVPAHRLRSAREPRVDRFDDEDVRAISRARLDVLLHLGSRELDDAVLDAARHGVWWCAPSYAGERSALSGVWEVLQRRPTTTMEVRVHDRGTPEGRVIDRSFMRTQRFSTGRNRARLHRNTITLLTLRLRELFEVGSPAEVSGNGSASASTALRPASRKVPGNMDTLTAVAGIGTFALKRVLQRGRWPGGWFIAYKRDDILTDAAVTTLKPDEFTTLRPPRDRFWADPFPAFVDGRHFILFEEYLFETGKGHIAVTEVGADGRCSPPVPVLEREHHLSYPFVFAWKGEQYMVPESVAAGRIEVYRAIDFPHRWELHGTLVDEIQAVDPTLVEWRGRWWMFVGAAQAPITDASDLNEQLHLFHAPSPLGPWTPHLRNPVKWDVRGSRPAGRIVRLNGALYRPAQDCTERYGGAITIQRIVRLDVDGYEETEVAAIQPDWSPNLIGTHTVNVVPGLAVIDARLSYSAARRAPR